MDINESIRAGIKLDELASAADNERPILARDWEPAAKTGLDELDKLGTALKNAQDKGEALEVLSSTMLDKKVMGEIATAFLYMEDEATPRLLVLDNCPTGMAANVKVFKRKVSDIAEDIQRSRLAFNKGKPSALDKLTAPLGISGMKSPPGYSITEKNGVTKGEIKVFRTPVILTRSAESNGISDEIAWLERGVWSKSLVKRGQLADGKTMVTALADIGLPIIGPNSSAAVSFLDEFRATNSDLLKPVPAAPGFGWTPGRESFLIGDDNLGAPAVCGVSTQERVGLVTGGNWDGWADAVKTHVSEHPRFLLGILAAACAPLLCLMEAPGFTLSYAGETSSGKTTGLRVISSVNGDPSDRKGNKNIQSWATSSMVGLVNMMTVAGTVALILDDTKNVVDSSLIPRTLYAITEGKEHTKGKSGGGNQSSGSWHTVLITSGETSITSMGTKSGGAAARVIEIRGKAFTGTAGDIGPMLSAFNKHHGHLVRRIAQWILDDTSRIVEISRVREEKLQQLNSSSTGGVESRMNGHLASLAVAAYVCNQVGLDINFDEALAEGVRCVKVSAAQADRTREALDKLLAFCHMNWKSFFGRGREGVAGTDYPNGGWIGYWPYGEMWNELAILPNVFSSTLRREGFNPDDILLSVEQHGWRRKDGTRDPRSNAMGARLITIARAAFFPEESGGI